ncbi:dipeptidyl aminopeptidase/acylaminoacyl peptidase [Halarchaeum rubridurum]|uniref:Dipeptidyl aminopeptidase/acylaminoacyl peptidase n=1 Tax=Halarchaeum rubridurum TaxID=489911 RepID=A0A830G223_9EURY|nr:S9 family peptidase [Halarchaeum rubridurum]MBP1955315.1 dipeptidyl aminopeptidase/acylaminoacyl peptidase [Halarchaeum rubridurum]GGM71388.1 peptidase S9 [Halarchaeum rubridurum]
MAYDIERYLNVRSAAGPTVGPDGQLAFTMDTTGVAQVWRLDGAREWPTQLSFGEEAVSFASYSPTRDELVYGVDEGGNERTQLYRLAGDGSEALDLTDDPESIHGWGGWSHDGERVAFAANRRDEGSFDAYVQRRDETGDAAELVVDGTDLDLCSVVGWSPSDDRLLVHETHSNRSHDLHVAHLDTGEVTALTADRAGEVRYSSVAWGPDGETLYVATDHERDTLALRELDPETGDLGPTLVDGDWDVSGVSVDHESRTMAVVRNVEGYSELSLSRLDADRERVPLPDPDLPEGVLLGLSVGPDGERLAAAVSTPTANANVHVVALDTGASERWTAASTAGIPTSTFREPELVHYESVGVDGRSPSARETESPVGLTIPAFFTRPDGDGPHPVIVDVHGGPESQRRPAFRALRQYFVDNGYAVFEPNVRGSSGYGTRYMNLDDVEKRMDAVADLDRGVEWLTARDDVDDERIVAYGGSYGGFMVLAALTEYPERWAAGVDVVGIADFVTFLENTGEWRREHREAEYGRLDADRAFLESISPINNVERIEAPLLVMHGANDPRVPVGEAEQIAAEASDHVPVEKLIFEDEGHGFSKLENRITAYRAVVDFLDEHVR